MFKKSLIGQVKPLYKAEYKTILLVLLHELSLYISSVHYNCFKYDSSRSWHSMYSFEKLQLYSSEQLDRWKVTRRDPRGMRVVLHMNLSHDTLGEYSLGAYMVFLLITQTSEFWRMASYKNMSLCLHINPTQGGKRKRQKRKQLFQEWKVTLWHRSHVRGCCLGANIYNYCMKRR